MPSYQSDSVVPYIDYIQANYAAAVGYSSIGRGYPDVSLLGHSYYVVANGQNVSVDGTSASSPVFAAFISLANSDRKSKGLPLIGFITPSLYSDGSSFIMDIVNGGKNNCSAGFSSYTCCSEGFPTMEGWDAATGLGSVNVASMLDWVNSYVIPSVDDDDSAKYTPGDIAGIVIGTIVGLSMIAGLCYYVFFVMVKGPVVASQMM
jgi:tripeptidyl-peptidase I